jgi:hypothetical protein
MPKTKKNLKVLLELIKEIELIYNISPKLSKKQIEKLSKKVVSIF